MKYHIEITEEDYIKFNIYHINNSAAGKKAKKISAISSLLLGVVIMALAYVVCNHFSLTLPYTAGCLVIVAAYVGFSTFYKQNKGFEKKFRKFTERQKAEGILSYTKVKDVEFLDDEIIEQTEDSTTHINYDKLEKTVIVEDYIYYYKNSQYATIIPFSALGDDKDKVISFLQSRINK